MASRGRTLGVTNSNDPRIKHFSSKNYRVGFQSADLGWLVQFGVRADIHEAWNHLEETESIPSFLNPYYAINQKLHELTALIRKAHVITETGLQSIGLTLYDFPSLSSFYSDLAHQRFVREATIRDLSLMISGADHSISMAIDEGCKNLPKKNDGVMDDYRYASKTLTEIESLCELQDVCQNDEILIIVNTSAPWYLVKEQIDHLLQNRTTEKSKPENLYGDWTDFGILSFIDLQEWITREFTARVEKQIQANLCCAHARSRAVTPDALDRTLKPIAEKMLSTNSPAFLALRTKALSELRGAIDYAMAEEKTTVKGTEAAREALVNWIPRHFPHNTSAFRRRAESDPETCAAMTLMLAVMQSRGDLDLPIEERIRRFWPGFVKKRMPSELKTAEDYEAESGFDESGEMLRPFDDTYVDEYED
jgi:hypothetical protein